jgi:hypothetical protein
VKLEIIWTSGKHPEEKIPASSAGESPIGRVYRGLLTKRNKDDGLYRLLMMFGDMSTYCP